MANKMDEATREGRADVLFRFLQSRTEAATVREILEAQLPDFPRSYNGIREVVKDLRRAGRIESLTRVGGGYRSSAYFAKAAHRNGAPAPAEAKPAPSAAALRADDLRIAGQALAAMAESMSTLRGAIETYCRWNGKDYAATLRGEVLDLLREALDFTEAGSVEGAE